MKYLSLQALLKPFMDINDINTLPAQAVTGLSLDSRTLKSGDVFFALTDTEAFMDEAVKKNAAAIISEKPARKNYAVPYIILKSLRENTGKIAAHYFHHPSKKMRVIGITGTNGKTSCAHFIAQALKMTGLNTAVIGTTGNGLIDKLTDNHLTTPDAITLQTMLARFYQEKVDVVAMEASSHGLSQHRTAGTEFFLGIFTNLTRDHLDYHATFDAYKNAKFKLFSESETMRYAILNSDDATGYEWLLKLKQLKPELQLYATTIKNTAINLPADISVIRATHIQTTPHGISASVSTPWGEGLLHANLLGIFNLSNLLSVIGTLGIMGYPLPVILEKTALLKGVAGRMQIANPPQDNQHPLVVIDYAHTPDALEKALLAMRAHGSGKLWCVFGCGGNRDKGKRPLMGRIAEIHADEIILTDDNPRDEKPATIVQEIIEGMTNCEKIIVEHDRHRAISHAIQSARPCDSILIAGKGHETVQITGDEKITFSDFLEARLQLLND